MKTRHVLSTPNLEIAEATMHAARLAGVLDDDIMLIARSDIELDSIPNSRKEADSDFIPAAIRGTGIGGAAGLLAGLLAVVIAPIGITLAGAGAVALAGALVGGWSSALMGSSLPDPVRQRFDEQIQAGNILVILDAARDVLVAAEPALERAGAVVLPFEETTALLR